MSTRRNRRPGGPKPSPPAPTPLKPDRSTLDHSTDSPYKGSISELKRVELDKSGNDDFKSPLVKQKAPKVFQKKSMARRGKNTRNTQKNLIGNFENTDVNPDHLQMAVALSKSCYEAENRSDGHSTKVYSTLERFGFSSNKPRLPPEYSRVNVLELSKSRKNSKFRFVTPVLLMRAEIDRESLITEKISSILQSSVQSSTHSEIGEKYEIMSDKLKEYICKEETVFTVDNKSYEQLETSSFYIEMWDRSFSSESKCGWLLRKWEDIPGREKSPQQVRRVKKNLLRSASPDLFDSDYESFSPKPQDGSSLKNVFESQSGIEHFESFCETSHLPESEKDISIVDLSQSDSEENIPDLVEHSNVIDLTQSDIEENKDEVLNSESPNAENTASDISAEVNITENYGKDYSPSANDSETTILNVPVENEILMQNLPPFDYAQKDSNINLSCNQKSLHVSHSTTGDLYSPPSPQTQKNSENTILNISLEHKTSTQKLPSFDYDQKYLDTNSSRNENSLNVPHSITEDSNSPASPHTEKNSETTILNISFEHEMSMQKLPPYDYDRKFLDTNSSCSENSLNFPHKTTGVSNSPPSPRLEKDYSSQESSSDDVIVISDEELNYSSANLNHYNLNDDEEQPMQLMDVEDDEIKNICLRLRIKYGQEKVEKTRKRRESETSNFGNSSCLTSEERTPTNSVNPKAQEANPMTQLAEESSLECRNLIKTMPCDEPQIDPSQFKNNSLESEENLQAIEAIPESDNFTCDSPEFLEEKSRDCANSPTCETSLPYPGSSTTPKSNVLIRSKNVTPMQDYTRMKTPEIQDKLNDFGLKPLKRKRGVQMLKYIYECTHPVIEKYQEDRHAESRKRIKYENSGNGGVKIIGDDLLKNEKFDGLIFERKHSKKIQSCAVPLQIAWFNFLWSNPEVHRKVLTYEPLHLELLYRMIKEQSGCKFHIDDLVSFLDKKCITFRVPQQKRRY